MTRIGPARGSARPSGRGTALAGVLALVLAGCGGTDDGVPAATAPPAPAEEQDQAAAAEGSGCVPGPGELPDGEWYGLVTEASEDAIELDLACFFTGEAAAAAAEQDGAEAPAPNDVYVRNQNTRLRTVPVAPEAEVVFYRTDDPASEADGDMGDYLAAVEERGGARYGVWVEVEGGAVEELREVWAP